MASGSSLVLGPGTSRSAASRSTATNGCCKAARAVPLQGGWRPLRCRQERGIARCTTLRRNGHCRRPWRNGSPSLSHCLERVDKKRLAARKAAAPKRSLHPLLGLTHRLPSETPLAFEERQRAEIRRLEAEGRARKRRESEQAAALALATASGRLARGASFKLWKGASGGGGGGRWERLVVEAVGEQQSSRPGFGAVPLHPQLGRRARQAVRPVRLRLLQGCGGGVSGARCAATAAL